MPIGTSFSYCLRISAYILIGGQTRLSNPKTAAMALRVISAK